MSRRGSAKAVEGKPSAGADPSQYRSFSESPIHDLGEGRLEAGPPDGRPQKVLRIDVTGAPPNLLGRLLVGSYITGQDQVYVSSREGLSVVQREEIRRAVDRILGMTIVAESPNSVEVQNFLDPGKFELPRLLHRVVQMLRAELAIVRAALTDDDLHRLPLIDDIEQEVDRFYILMVRQLLLSSESPRIARDIDVESHHYQIGDRLVAKVLEVIGDLIHGVGTDLERHLPTLRRTAPRVVQELATRVERLDLLLARTMDAFGHLSLVEANSLLNTLGETLPRDEEYGQEIAQRVRDRRTAVGAQRISCSLDMALEMLIIVNEVTINRGVEPSTEVPSSIRPEKGRHRPDALRERAETEIAIFSSHAKKSRPTV
jgi:phosphate uptake regulator